MARAPENVSIQTSCEQAAPGVERANLSSLIPSAFEAADSANLHFEPRGQIRVSFKSTCDFQRQWSALHFS
jgi:hypothetical protein